MTIETPVNIGDTLYRVVRTWTQNDLLSHIKIVETTVVSMSIVCNKKGEWTKRFRTSEACSIIEGDERIKWRVLSYDHNFDKVGEGVFKTYEEALAFWNKLPKKSLTLEESEHATQIDPLYKYVQW